MPSGSIFELLESNVRTYCREFPAVFERALGPHVYDVEGHRFLDFLSGAGALNYGHNHPALTAAVVDYLQRNGIVHSLDLHTDAKARFLRALDDTVLKPRGLDYRVQFTGPTGTNAVEAALKLARKVTGRTGVVAFTNAFHGASLGALAATAASDKRAAAGVTLDNVVRLPFDGFVEEEGDVTYAERMLLTPGSGIDAPAAIVLETVQGEGGLNVASSKWLQGIARIARELGALLIVDEIQTGCGRTGSFFDFERAKLRPDLICLSKSLSGLGLPLSVLLIAPEHDIWKPGEHNGTFRGHNLAFVSAAKALTFWEDPEFVSTVQRNCQQMQQALQQLVQQPGCEDFVLKGRGLLSGVEVHDPELARAAREHAFTRGLIFETCGPADSVIKLMPPLNIDARELQRGIEILTEAVTSVVRPNVRLAVGS